jgi:hypothetical protein
MPEFEDKGEPLMRKNLKAVGAMDDLSYQQRVVIMQQRLAELLTALEKAGIKTDI